MATIKLRKSRITSRKHLFFGKVDETTYLFVIRHLVSINDEIKNFDTLYRFGNLKIIELVFFVSEETFRAMVSGFFLEQSNGDKLPTSFEITLIYD